MQSEKEKEKEQLCDTGYIYVVQIINPKLIYNVYGVGKTNEVNIQTHLRQHYTDVNLIFKIHCPFITRIEEEIIQIFDLTFVEHDRDYQSYIGDINDMLIEINIIVKKYIEAYNKTKHHIFTEHITSLLTNNTVTMTDNDLYNLLDDMDGTVDAHKELYDYNILSEYNRLKKYKNLNAYDQAIYYICEVLIDCVSHDKINGNYSTNANNETLKRAGRLLNMYGNVSCMQEIYMTWIPKRYRDGINVLWSGIGNWQG